MTTFLIVDDEPDMLEVCEETLRELENARFLTASDPEKGLQILREEKADFLLTDLKMPRMSGIELIRKARQIDPEIVCLVFTGFPTVETAVEAMKLGAVDYLPKPFSPDHLLLTMKRLLKEKNLQEENRSLTRFLEKKSAFGGLTGESAPIQTVREIIRKTAPTDTDVLISGESGSGKEVVARAIHEGSLRREGRFVPVDCGAIPENLLETEFFGYERGAFTGAHQPTMGLLEFAHRGTFFLDEISELALPLQAKLLRVLQERSFRRVGSKEEIRVDIRLIAATNRDLKKETESGRFREDIYYRLNVIHVEVPPLRDRKEDIPLFLEHFIARFNREFQKNVKGPDSETLQALKDYPWPGNVRELQNIVKRMLLFVEEDRISLKDLPEFIREYSGGKTSEPAGFFSEKEKIIARFERGILDALLKKYRGNVQQAALEANIPKGTFYRLMKKYDLLSEHYR